MNQTPSLDRKVTNEEKNVNSEASFNEFDEREYPLRQGSVIRSPEGVLFSRSGPGMVPITSCPDAEIDDVLDAYGDALDRIEELRLALQNIRLFLVNKSSEIEMEQARLLVDEALKKASNSTISPAQRERSDLIRGRVKEHEKM